MPRTCPPSSRAVTLRVVSAVGGTFLNLHQSAIAVLAFTGTDALGDDRALLVFLPMCNHLRAGIGLLAAVG